MTTPIFKPGLYYSPRDVCERLGISQGTIMRWRRKHGFPATLVTQGCVRHNGADMNAWLAAKDEAQNSDFSARG